MHPKFEVALAGFALTFLSATLPVGAVAQELTYPNKPVKILVGTAAGGAADALTRIFTQALNPALGQHLLVENRPGASGTLAAKAAAQGAPDGYTLVAAPPTVTIVAPYLYKNLGFDPAVDLKPVTLLAGGPVVLAVHAGIAASTVADLAALARTNKVAYGAAGPGTNSHLTAEMFFSTLGVKALGVHYKGDGQAAVDVAGGQIQMIFTSYNLLEPLIRAGKLRALAVTGRKRLANLPDVPTVSETKGFEDFEAYGWVGIFAPKGTPDSLIKRLDDEWQVARKREPTKSLLDAAGLSAISFDNTAGFAAFQQQERTRWVKVIKDANITAE